MAVPLIGDITIYAQWSYTGGSSSGSGGGGGSIASATLNKTSVTPQRNADGNYSDLIVDITIPTSNSVSGIKNDTKNLKQGVDYTVADGKLTIKGIYLDTLLEGATQLTIDMKSGKDPVLTVNINKTDHEEPAAKPSELETPANETAEQTAIIMTIGNKTYTLNGISKTSDAAPAITNSRTFVPLRFAAEGLDAEVKWDADTKTITITKDDATIVMKVGANTYTVNGEQKQLDTPAYINDSRTLVPIRFIAEALEAKIDWNSQTKVVTITIQE